MRSNNPSLTHFSYIHIMCLNMKHLVSIHIMNDVSCKNVNFNIKSGVKFTVNLSLLP